MKSKWLMVIAVWVAAVALFGSINVFADSPNSKPIPDVVGLTVAQAIQAYADAGFVKVPHVQPGNLDPEEYADYIVVKQTPQAAGKEVNPKVYQANLWISKPCPSPSPSDEPSPSPSPSDEPSESPSPEPSESPTVEPSPEPSEEPEPVVMPEADEDEMNDIRRTSDALSYTL